MEKELDKDNLLMVSKIVQAEAEGEPYEGKIAVAEVIFTRLNHFLFPVETTAEVIFQPGQFAPVETMNSRYWKIKSPEIQYNCEKAVLEALDNHHTSELVSKGALYFYNPSKVDSDNWIVTNTEKLVEIGNHIFAR